MPTPQENYQQGVVMALNGWTVDDINAFSIKLHIPTEVTEQMLTGYRNTLRKQKHRLFKKRVCLKGIPESINRDVSHL